MIDEAIVQRALPHLRNAAESMLKAWDHLRTVEKIVGFEITTDELCNGLCAGLDAPSSAQDMITDTIASEFLETSKTSPK